MSQTTFIRRPAAAAATTAVVAGLAAGVLAVPMVEVAAGTARPAQAIGTQRRVFETSRFNAEPVKSVTASCPDDTVRYAGGGAVDYGQPGAGGAALTGIVPDTAGREVTVTAAAPAGQPGAWSLTAYAVCSSSVEPLRIVRRGAGAATAVCPADTSLFGLGFHVAGDPSAGHVTGITMDSALTAVQVTAGGPGAETAEVTAIALCRPPAVEMRLVRAGSGDAGWPKTAFGQDAEPDLAAYATGATVAGPAAATLDAVVPGPDDGVTWARGTLFGATAQSAGARADGGGDESATVEAALIGTFH
jgi:hypothetical protein